MNRQSIVMALTGIMLLLPQDLPAQEFTEADFLDAPGVEASPTRAGRTLPPGQRIIHRVQPQSVRKTPASKASPIPAQTRMPMPASPPEMTGRRLVHPAGRAFPGKRPVSKMELAVILDRYLDYVRQQKAEIEKKMENIPIQKGLPGDTLARLDSLVTTLDGLTSEEKDLALLVRDLSNTVYQQGNQIQQMKITDLVTDRRLDRLEQATGLATGEIAGRLEEEDQIRTDKMAARVERLEDLLYQSMSQIAENSSQIHLSGTGSSALAAAPGNPVDGGWMRTSRIPFAAAGGIAVGAERQAYRRKLVNRVRRSLAQRDATEQAEDESDLAPNPVYHSQQARAVTPRSAPRFVPAAPRPVQVARAPHSQQLPPTAQVPVADDYAWRDMSGSSKPDTRTATAYPETRAAHTLVQRPAPPTESRDIDFLEMVELIKRTH